LIHLYGENYDRMQLLRHLGDISQVAEAKVYQLNDGNEKGTDAIGFRTGSGLNFTVLPNRGLDISYADYNGIPLCWRSGTGDVEASHYDPNGLGWLRGFYGGLLTTCGMTQAGSSNVDGDEDLGLHGRVSHIPAKNVWVDTRWEGNRYIMWVQGKVSEITALGEHLCRTRRIWTELGSNKIHIEDIIENLGYQDCPHMYLFHINIGFPILADGSELLAPSSQVTPRDDHAKNNITKYNFGEPPSVDFQEQVYYHKMEPDVDNHIRVALVNHGFNQGQGIGIAVRYHKTQFPNFVQWKMCGHGAYVMGLEPSNCKVEGRASERENGTLQHIEPGGRRHYEVEISVLTSKNEINAIQEKISNTSN